MSKREDIKKVLIIGSGPIIIGQACEFDYSGTQACKALRKLGYQIILVNSNPATIMTDPEIADVTYIEPLNVKRLEQIIAKERPDAILPNLGGQSGLNLCSELAGAGVLDKYNVKVIGVQVDAIERGEDRIEFKKTMNKLGIEMARSEVAYSVDEALAIADKLALANFKVLIVENFCNRGRPHTQINRAFIAQHRPHGATQLGCVAGRKHRNVGNQPYKSHILQTEMRRAEVCVVKAAVSADNLLPFQSLPEY